MQEHGAQRIVQMGSTDAADRDMFSDFETWEDEVLWPALAAKYGVEETDDVAGDLQSGITVEISSPRKSTLRQDVEEAVVVAAKDLSAEKEAAKKHIEIQLPTGMTYSAGDYLAVLPLNPRENVNRAMRNFKLAWDAHMNISADRRTTLPTNTSISAFDVFSAYVELAQPATKRVWDLIPRSIFV
jgi:cytochrome P450 / NADPH-cytochrome P450 reductase